MFLEGEGKLEGLFIIKEESWVLFSNPVGRFLCHKAVKHFPLSWFELHGEINTYIIPVFLLLGSFLSLRLCRVNSALLTFYIYMSGILNLSSQRPLNATASEDFLQLCKTRRLCWGEEVHAPVRVQYSCMCQKQHLFGGKIHASYFILSLCLQYVLLPLHVHLLRKQKQSEENLPHHHLRTCPPNCSGVPGGWRLWKRRQEKRVFRKSPLQSEQESGGCQGDAGDEGAQECWRWPSSSSGGHSSFGGVGRRRRGRMLARAGARPPGWGSGGWRDTLESGLRRQVSKQVNRETGPGGSRPWNGPSCWGAVAAARGQCRCGGQGWGRSLKKFFFLKKNIVLQLYYLKGVNFLFWKKIFTNTHFAGYRTVSMPIILAYSSLIYHWSNFAMLLHVSEWNSCVRAHYTEGP